MGERQRGFGGEDADWVLEEREKGQQEVVAVRERERVFGERVIGMDGRDWMCLRVFDILGFRGVVDGCDLILVFSYRSEGIRYFAWYRIFLLV